MHVRSRKVLIIQYSSNRDGSAFSGLLSANGLREAGWRTHVAFGFAGPMVAEFEAAGHETSVVPHKNWLRRKNGAQFLKDVSVEWRRARAFEELIDTFRPDLVYINTLVSLAGALAARRRKIPCIWHVREMFGNVGGEMHAPRWFMPAIRYVIKCHSTVTIANSTATARNVLGKGAVARVPVIPNAVEVRFFCKSRSREAARRVLDLPDGVIIGIPGSFRPTKGHAFFLRSTVKVLKERPKYRVLITGGLEGASAEQVKGLVYELGLADQVFFTGWLEDMPAFYRACDIICVPSRAEPFGRTIIEAFASGTPVVATAVGGIEETVTHHETGLLVPYGDEDALANAVFHLVEDHNLQENLRRRAQKRAEDEFHERIYKRRIAALAERSAGRQYRS